MKEDQSVNTGLTLRGFEVWAVTPGHYRHYHTLFLRLPQRFPYEIVPDDLDIYPAGERWKIGFTRPDGQFSSSWTGCTREEAEAIFEKYCQDGGTVGCQFEVNYKRTDENGDYLPYSFCDATATGAKAWGTTWDTYPAYAPLKFDLTEEEAKQVIAWREQADKDWFAARPDFLPREEKITEAQVAGLSATAAEFYVDAKEAFGDSAVAVVTSEVPTATECLECGATYDHPGHVEPGGMGCDRCN